MVNTILRSSDRFSLLGLQILPLILNKANIAVSSPSVLGILVYKLSTSRMASRYIFGNLKHIEIGGSGGAIYLPFLVLKPHCLVNTEGNVNTLGTRSLVYNSRCCKRRHGMYSRFEIRPERNP